MRSFAADAPVDTYMRFAHPYHFAGRGIVFLLKIVKLEKVIGNGVVEK